MSHTLFRTAGLASSAFLLGFELNALTRPLAHLSSLGLPSYPTNEAAQRLNYALMRVWGIRNVVVSSLMTLIWTTGDNILFAKGLLVASLLAVMDGVVAKGLTGGNVLQHWSVPPGFVIVTAGLYGLFD